VSLAWLHGLRPRWPTSLRSRLLISATVILSLFFIITAFALENAFRASALQAQEDKLEGLAYSVMGALVPNEQDVLNVALAELRDPRLREPATGIRAALYDENLRPIWRSADFLIPPPLDPVGVGEKRFELQPRENAFKLTYGLRYIDLQDDPHRYYVVVIEGAGSYRDQLRLYRSALLGWLIAAGAGLLLIQLIALDWVLAPLRRMTAELRAIERGTQAEIRGHYPDELVPLTDGLNEMIVSERNRQVRYRNALGDLAHSVKTPLAVMNGVVEDPAMPENARRSLREQLAVMRQITDYQLRKASTAGRRSLSEPIALDPIAAKLTQALVKVYADRNIRFELDINDDLRLRADSNDLFELVGNLLDNACKYGGGRIRLSAWRDRAYSVIRVDDDGPGFPDDAIALLQRGMRADMQKPGQGIGLAAAREMSEAYEGNVELGRSEDLGGGSVTVRLRA